MNETRPIQLLEKSKYLGLVIDKPMKFIDHADNVIKTITFELNFLYKCHVQAHLAYHREFDE